MTDCTYHLEYAGCLSLPRPTVTGISLPLSSINSNIVPSKSLTELKGDGYPVLGKKDHMQDTQHSGN